MEYTTSSIVFSVVTSVAILAAICLTRSKSSKCCDDSTCGSRISKKLLASSDGKDPSKPILVAIEGTVFDVSAGAEHYGPGGSYHVFAGKEIARYLAKNKLNLTDDDGAPLTPKEME